MTAMNYALVTSLDSLAALTDKLLTQGKSIGFDVETGYYGPDRVKGSLDVSWDQQFICGFSITNDRSWARYVPVAHDNAANLPERETWEIMKPVLERLPVWAHNAKFEKKNLRALEWKDRGPRIEMNVGGDTMLMEYVLSECQVFNLKDLVKFRFSHEMRKIEELFEGYTKKQIDALRFNVLELTPDVVNYGCEDSAWCLALRDESLEKALRERKFIYGLEHAVMEIMCDTEDRGLHVEWAEMEEERKKAYPFLSRMEKSVRDGLSEMAGRDLSEMNFGSSKQMQELLYRDLGLTTTRLTASGQKEENAHKESWQKMSTDKEAMKGLSAEYPPIKKLLELREVENAIQRFDKWLDENHFAKDDRAHPNYSQVTVGTGRFAAKEPPVHQMPKEWRFATVLGRDVWDDHEWAEILADGQPYEDYWTGNFRDYVSATPGTYQIGFDYSQIELRVLAGVSKEPLLLDAFSRGIDVHSVTAAMMLDKPLAKISKSVDRPVGKTMNFALLYQMGWQSLSERLNITPERAQQLYARYFAQFRSIDAWMNEVRTKGKERGYSETFFGRKYTVHELKHYQRSVRSKGERVLINAPIQGCAADYMKIAMGRAVRNLKEHELWGKVMLIHHLHDSMTFEADNSINPWELRELLQKAVVFDIKGWPKIVADWELGQRHGSSAVWKNQPVEFIDGVWEVVAETPDKREQTLESHVARVSPPPQTYTMAQTPAISNAIASEPSKPGVEVIIEVNRMPDQKEVERFKDYVLRNPGNNEIVLRTPEGDVNVGAKSSINVADQGTLSMVFSGASVRQSKASVDIDALAEGLAL